MKKKPKIVRQLDIEGLQRFENMLHENPCFKGWLHHIRPYVLKKKKAINRQWVYFGPEIGYQFVNIGVVLLSKGMMERLI
jgi:hypothetical protein